MLQRLFHSAHTQYLDIISEEAEILNEAKHNNRQLHNSFERTNIHYSLGDRRHKSSLSEGPQGASIEEERTHFTCKGRRQFLSKTNEWQLKQRKSEDSGRHEIAVYSQVFEDIIKSDNAYGALLMNVKNKYDEYLHALTHQLAELKKDTTQQLHAEVQELAEKLESSERKRNQTLLQKAQLKRVMLEERRGHNDTLNLITKDLKISRMREGKYRKLVKLMKKQGYPLEEAYESFVKSERKTHALDSNGKLGARESPPEGPSFSFSSRTRKITHPALLIPRKLNGGP